MAAKVSSGDFVTLKMTPQFCSAGLERALPDARQSLCLDSRLLRTGRGYWGFITSIKCEGQCRPSLSPVTCNGCPLLVDHAFIHPAKGFELEADRCFLDGNGVNGYACRPLIRNVQSGCEGVVRRLCNFEDDAQFCSAGLERALPDALQSLCLDSRTVARWKSSAAPLCSIDYGQERKKTTGRVGKWPGPLAGVSSLLPHGLFPTTNYFC